MPKIEVEVDIEPSPWAEIEAIVGREGRRPGEVAGDLLHFAIKERR